MGDKIKNEKIVKPERPQRVRPEKNIDIEIKIAQKFADAVDQKIKAMQDPNYAKDKIKKIDNLLARPKLGESVKKLLLKRKADLEKNTDYTKKIESLTAARQMFLAKVDELKVKKNAQP